MSTNRRILGVLLEEEGVSRSRIERGLSAQSETGERLGEALVRLGEVEEELVSRTLARQLGLPFEAPPINPDPEALQLVTPLFARKHGVVPVRIHGRHLHVAMADPLDLRVTDDLQFQCGRRVVPLVSTPSGVAETLRSAYSGEVSELVKELPGGELPGIDSNGASEREQEERQRAASAPVVRMVDLLLRRAVEAGASDLHVEQRADDVLVRERVDGVLRRVTELPARTRRALLSRIKVMAGMDISVKRKPQDGGFPLPVGNRQLSVRASTLPVEGGEKAVLRLLDPEGVPETLDGLGMSDSDLGRMRTLLKGGRGVILAAGPTGSGKSSTLFGALAELDRTRMNVVTLEDPIEYRVPGVNQVQVNPRAGLTFPAALRSVLRQDPDVIMVGEIRDRETAEIAMAAAITGHLVLSSIHTIDAPSGVARLLQMGVPAHLVAGGLAGIVSQRLVRRTCGRCRGDPGGCANCHEGYRGRIGVFQVLVADEALREAIASGADTSELRRRAESSGMESLAVDARRKVAEGITTPHEVGRVLDGAPGERSPCTRCGGGVPAEALGCPRCGVPTTRSCVCGSRLRSDWRFCAFCLRRAPPAA